MDIRWMRMENYSNKENIMSEEVNTIYRDNMFNIKRTITMFCGSKMYDQINADSETTSMRGIPLDCPIKYVYDSDIRVYYTILRNNGWMDDKFGDNDVVIVNNNQFGDEEVKHEDIITSIARITNFTKNPGVSTHPIES